MEYHLMKQIIQKVSGIHSIPEATTERVPDDVPANLKKNLRGRS